MKSREYWERRMEELAARQQAADEALERRLRDGYGELRSAIDRELAGFYGRYAGLEGLSMAEARKRLTGAELETFRLSLEEFRDKAVAGGFDRELEELYLRSRVSRLQAIQTQIELRTRALFQDQRDLIHGHLAEGYTETYYRTVFELGRETRIPASFARIDAAAVEQVLARPWLEGHFSDRIWSNRDLLLRELGATLAQGLVRGDGLGKMSRLLAKRMEVSYYRAATLVETESAHCAAEATLRGYRETGVEAYDFLASLDERTCGICGPLDARTFRLTERETGVNYPPMHPRCRCTTTPHLDDYGVPGTRAARDPDTGKTVQIPADVTYEKWKMSISRGKSAGDGKASAPGNVEQIGTVAFSDREEVLQWLERGQAEAEALDHEINYTVTTDGKVWRVTGEVGTVDLSGIPSDLTGSYSYHNHPRDKTWFSFSAFDVATFIQSGEWYSKAADHLFEYIMERTPKTIDAAWEEVYHKFIEIYNSEVRKLAFDGVIDMDMEGYHETMRRMGEEYGFFYERRQLRG